MLSGHISCFRNAAIDRDAVVVKNRWLRFALGWWERYLKGETRPAKELQGEQETSGKVLSCRNTEVMTAVHQITYQAGNRIWHHPYSDVCKYTDCEIYRVIKALPSLREKKKILRPWNV